MKRAAIIRRTGEIEDRLRHTHPDWQKQMAQWEAGIAHNQPQWTVMRPEVDDISTGGSRYLPQPDGSFSCPRFRAGFSSRQVHRENGRPEYYGLPP